MRAAEKLIADRGVENVSIRDIVAFAQQKNESALQYHFKNLSGLLEAVHTQRSEQAQQRRAELLDAVLSQNQKPTLRELCALMVEPSFLLARSSIDFRHYVKAFGHVLVTDASPLETVIGQGGGGASGAQLGSLLRKALPDLDDKDYTRRMEAAVILCSASMYRQARQKNAFRGQQSDLFLNSLIDALVGLLGAPVSPATQALKQ